MANKNYQAGVRLEREVIKLFKQVGGKATRTAGSHGWIDVVGTAPSSMALSFILKGFVYLGMDEPAYVYSRFGNVASYRLFVYIYQSTATGETAYLIQCKRKKVKRAS